MAQRGGRKKNSLIEENFKGVITMRLKKHQHQCIHCGHQTTKNAVRGLSHLDQCGAYKQKITKKEDISFSSRSVQLPITIMIRPLS